MLDHAIHSGLKRAGIDARLRFAIEKDRAILDAAAGNNPIIDPDTMMILGGIEEMPANDLPRVDILSAGLPCTGASVSGRSKNALAFAEQHETAGALFVAFLQIVKACNPAAVVLENVVPYSNTISMHVIRDVLQTWGYEIHETTLDGLSHGAVEDRKRMCMVAVTRGLDLDLDTLRPVDVKPDSIGEVLDTVAPDHPSWRRFEYLNAKEERDRAAGKGFAQQVLTPDARKWGTIGAGYYKIRSTEPRIRHPFDPSLSRLLTPAEHARGKTVPQKLIDGLSNTLAHTILGNGVIHNAFVAVGEVIGNALDMNRQRCLVAA